MSAFGDSSDEDEWGVAEIPLPKGTSDKRGCQDDDDWNEEQASALHQETLGAEEDDTYWEVVTKVPIKDKVVQLQQLPPTSPNSEAVSSPPPPPPTTTTTGSGEPMILVNMTILSNSAIHNKFDKMSVNDPTAVSALRRKIERDYERFASSASLLSNRTVVPCGTSVWRAALVDLRNEHSGHYFAPIFPPNSM